MVVMFGTREVLEELAELRRHGDELRDEIRELQAQNREELGFTREVIRRNEIAFQEFRLEMRESRAAYKEELKAVRAETRAQTKGFYALIDRLEGGGPAPAT